MDPFTILVGAVLLTLGVSFCCSLAEAALYSVPLAHVRHSAETGSRSGTVLLELKQDIGRPIAAILILNTTANTGGASIAGWAAGSFMTELGLVFFSVGFVLAILFMGEILPKIIGVTFCRPVSQIVAIPVYFAIKVFSPLVAASKFLSKRIEGGQTEPLVSPEEVLSMAALGTEEGALDHFEGSVVVNVIGLDRLLVRDILTPRVVVFRQEESTTVGAVKDQIGDWTFSRVPLYREEEPDNLVSYVNQRDVFRELLHGNDDTPLKQLARPLQVVPELMRADKLLLEMFEKKEHICAVVDEHGGLAGIITLEDIIEEIVGREIVDEYDTVSDLRTFARIMRVVKGRRKGGRAERDSRK